MDRLKLYQAHFECVWPVGCALIILAADEDQAMEIARKTVRHTEVESVEPLTMEVGVVYYGDGDY